VIMLQIERFFVRQPLNGSDWPALIESQRRLKADAEPDGLPPLAEIAFA